MYVCPECGDLGCGAISAIVEVTEGSVVWRDFGSQNNYEADVWREEYKHLGPYAFEARSYTELFEALIRGELQRGG